MSAQRRNKDQRHKTPSYNDSLLGEDEVSKHAEKQGYDTPAPHPQSKRRAKNETTAPRRSPGRQRAGREQKRDDARPRVQLAQPAQPSRDLSYLEPTQPQQPTHPPVDPNVPDTDAEDTTMRWKFVRHTLEVIKLSEEWNEARDNEFAEGAETEIRELKGGPNARRGRRGSI